MKKFNIFIKVKHRGKIFERQGARNRDYLKIFKNKEIYLKIRKTFRTRKIA